MSIVLKTLAFIVIAFFATLWATGNDINSFKSGLLRWAEGNEQVTGRRSDWGD